MEIEAKYIVGGMAFDVHPCFHIRILNYMQEVLTLAVVEDTKQHVSIDQSIGQRLEMLNI